MATPFTNALWQGLGIVATWLPLKALLLWPVALGNLNTPAHPETPLTACVDHYPPYHDYDEATGRWSGINVDLLRAVADEANLPLRFTKDTPFARCLAWMQAGEVDIMAGLLRDDDRARYMELIRYRDISNKYFVVASESLRIDSFDDLEGLRIGMLFGFKYFDRFDNENRLFTKVEVPNVAQLLNMLRLDRTDVVVVSETHWLGLQRSNADAIGDLRLAGYRYQLENPVHIGLSMKSVTPDVVEKVRAAVERLRLRNRFEAIIRNSLGYGYR